MWLHYGRRMDSGPARTDADRRDAELAAALGDWVTAADPDVVEAIGPFETGMEPTWVLRFRSRHLEADACLFSGAFLGVSAAKPSDPLEDNLGAGQEDLCAAQLTAMLNDLMTASQGSQIPRWLGRAAN